MDGATNEQRPRVAQQLPFVRRIRHFQINQPEERRPEQPWRHQTRGAAAEIIVPACALIGLHRQKSGQYQKQPQRQMADPIIFKCIGMRRNDAKTGKEAGQIN